MKKIIFMSLGFVAFGIGTLGIFVPLLPTVPFYLLTAYLWMNSSPRLYAYLSSNRYYQRYIHDVVVNKNVTKTKLAKMIVTLFILLAIPFVLFDSLHVRIILATVFVAHIIAGYCYFKK